MSKWLPLTAFCIAALLLASCQRTGRPNPAPASPAAAAASPAPVSALPDTQARRPSLRAPAVSPAAPAVSPAAPPASITLQPSSHAARPLPGASHSEAGGPGGPQPAPAQKGLASAATLMALGRERRTMPEDFKIGPLGDDRGDRQDENRALSAAGTFLSRLVGGGVDKKLIAPESQDTMADTIAFGLKQGNIPLSYRLGAPKTREDGEVTAAVRLFGAEGTSEGEIYVSPAGSQWLVADLQLSLARLSIKREKPKEKFFPLEYRWLLEE